MLSALHSLDYAVGGSGSDAQVLSRMGDTLVVERVDGYALGTVCLCHHASALKPDGVGEFLEVGILRMAQRLHRYLAEVLCHFAAEGYRQGLYAAANGQRGNLSVEGQTGHEQLRQVACGIDVTQFRRRLLARPEGIYVGSAAENKSVYPVECRDDDLLVGHGRNEQGRSSGLDNLPAVAVAHGVVDAVVVCSDANHWPPASFGE